MKRKSRPAKTGRFFVGPKIELGRSERASAPADFSYSPGCGRVAWRRESAIPGRFRRKARRDEVDERAHLGRRMAVRQVHGIDATELDVRLIQGERHQPAR